MRPILGLMAMPAALIASVGFISSGVHAATFLTVPAAQRGLFPNADHFIEANLSLTDDQRSEIKTLSGVRQRESEQAVWRAMRGEELLGWFIVDEVVGKHEFITYAAGLSPQAEVIGIDVLIYRETYGYQVSEAPWRQQFEGKKLQDDFKLDEDITNISGATLSCRNLTDGVKRLLALQKVALLGHG